MIRIQAGGGRGVYLGSTGTNQTKSQSSHRQEMERQDETGQVNAVRWELGSG